MPIGAPSWSTTTPLARTSAPGSTTSPRSTDPDPMPAGSAFVRVSGLCAHTPTPGGGVRITPRRISFAVMVAGSTSNRRLNRPSPSSGWNISESASAPSDWIVASTTAFVTGLPDGSTTRPVTSVARFPQVSSTVVSAPELRGPGAILSDRPRPGVAGIARTIRFPPSGTNGKKAAPPSARALSSSRGVLCNTAGCWSRSGHMHTVAASRNGVPSARFSLTTTRPHGGRTSWIGAAGGSIGSRSFSTRSGRGRASATESLGARPVFSCIGICGGTSAAIPSPPVTPNFSGKRG